MKRSDAFDFVCRFAAQAETDWITSFAAQTGLSEDQAKVVASGVRHLMERSVTNGAMSEAEIQQVANLVAACLCAAPGEPIALPKWRHPLDLQALIDSVRRPRR